VAGAGPCDIVISGDLGFGEGLDEEKGEGNIKV
jgi:hypothetical protein